VTASLKAPRCPHCNGLLGPAAEAVPEPGGPLRYDLEELALLATKEKAYDETVKVRVSQEDIRKLVAKRKRAPK
jgi:hypothetical protein